MFQTTNQMLRAQLLAAKASLVARFPTQAPKMAPFTWQANSDSPSRGAGRVRMMALMSSPIPTAETNASKTLKTHSCFPASLTFCPCRNPFTFPGGPTKHLQMKHQKNVWNHAKENMSNDRSYCLVSGFRHKFHWVAGDLFVCFVTRSWKTIYGSWPNTNLQWPFQEPYKAYARAM